MAGSFIYSSNCVKQRDTFSWPALTISLAEWTYDRGACMFLLLKVAKEAYINARTCPVIAHIGGVTPMSGFP